jgi:molecular chaperone GrpE
MEHDDRQNEVETARDDEEARLSPDGEVEQGTETPRDAGSGEEERHPLAVELEELRDRHVRLVAEFENYRKRTREELLSSASRAQAALIGSLLDVFDDFQRMHELVPEQATVASILEGVELVDRKLQRVLAEAGLEVVEPVGEAFDPERMEAVARVPVTDSEEDDRVDQVFQRGVVFKGHLVRPARVAVRKAD